MAYWKDKSHLRKDAGAIDFAILRHIDLNLLKQKRFLNVSIKNKQLRAGRNHDYLLSILQPILTPL